MKKKFDYKDANALKKYISKRGKILGKDKTGLSSKEQRLLTVEIKKARFMALLPYLTRE